MPDPNRIGFTEQLRIVLMRIGMGSGKKRSRQSGTNIPFHYQRKRRVYAKVTGNVGILGINGKGSVGLNDLALEVNKQSCQ
jgi:hypothetical protein